MSSEQPPTPQLRPQPGQYPPHAQQSDPYQPQATAYPQPGQYQPGPYAQQPTEVMAIVGLVCAFVCWPAGLVLSILASKKVKRTGTQGKGLALAGLIVSCVVGALSVIYAIVVIIAIVAATQSAGGITSSLGDFSTTASHTSTTDYLDIDPALTDAGGANQSYRATDGAYPTDTPALPGVDTTRDHVLSTTNHPDRTCEG